MRLRSKILLSFAAYGLFFGAVLCLTAVTTFFLVEDTLLERFLEAAVADSQRAPDDGSETVLLPGFESFQKPEDLPWPDAASLPPGVHEVEQYKHLAVEVHPVTGAKTFLLLDESESGLQALLRDILLSIAGVLMAVLAVGAVLAFLLSRQLTRPLETLVGRIAVLDPDDPLEPLDSHDEIGFLSEQFGNWTRRVNEHVARERSFTRFASHELRSPITVIRGSAAILLGDPQLPPSLRRAATRTARAAERMSRLVDVFLHLGRADAAIRAELVDGKRLTSMIRQLAASWPRLEVVIEESENSRKTAVMTDRQLLSIVLENLIANAEQHGASPLRVEVDLPRLRLDNRLAASPDRGHGFGLEIVGRVCERLGVGLAAGPAGQCFRCELTFPEPVALDPAAAPALAAG